MLAGAGECPLVPPEWSPRGFERYRLGTTTKRKLVAMDSLFSLLGTAACLVLLGSVLLMIVALFLPKQQRGQVFRRIGRWFQGF
jgi:hypothetical protein